MLKFTIIVLSSTDYFSLVLNLLNTTIIVLGKVLICIKILVMKKKYLLLMLFLSVINLHSQSKKHTIVYTASTVEMMENKVDKSFVSGINKIMAKTNIQFQLVINDNISLYFVKDALEENDSSLKVARVLYGAMDKYYIDKTKNESIIQKNAYGDLFLLPNKKVKWKLSKESKKIGKYNCFKATTRYTIDNGGDNVFDKKVVAWYTPEINSNFGPRGYHGLPGLILSLQDDIYLFTATELKLNQKKEAKISKPTKGKKMSNEEFKNLEKGYTRG